MYKDRYVYDALYGPVRFPEDIWKAIHTPELQRLREVRLCNINSLCLPGGANINRYEHSLGTAYLALRCIETWPNKLDKKTARRIVLAALLHDIGSTAFGHSIQYVLDLRGYEHESLYDSIFSSASFEPGKFKYQHARVEPIYFGMPKRLISMLPDEDLRAISDMVAGRGPYGPLINGSIDLDNIDNVYRLAYHIGIVNSGKTPLALAQCLRVSDGGIVVEESASAMVEEWYEVRRTLYHYLLLNPEEFSAKCMLQEALELAQLRSLEAFRWNDVDYQLLEKLSNCSAETYAIIARLMLGDLYGCAGIYSVGRIAIFDELSNPELRNALEQDIDRYVAGLNLRGFKKPNIAIHLIKDVNKTQRQLHILTEQGNILEIGCSTRRILLGLFFKNVHLSMTSINQKAIEESGLRGSIRQLLREKLEDGTVEELMLYGEVSNDAR